MMKASRGIKQRLFELGILGGLLAIGGAIVVALGLVPIKASSGNWPITTWTMSFASGRSIAAHSASIKAPPLDEPEMVQLGAATFESNCAWCHGSPLRPHAVVAGGMTPPPPQLSKTAAKWKSRELFYIVKHGIKFTGMPAWPTQQREQEIWPVVAFLREFEFMSDTEYQGRLRSNYNQTNVTNEATVLQNCTSCHGTDGKSIAGPRVPNLNGQNAVYLAASLQAFRVGNRPSGIMQPIVARLTLDELQNVAKHYSSQPRDSFSTNKFDGQEAHSDDLAEGRRLIRDGDQKSKIPSCIDCHGPTDYSEPSYPLLAGQSKVYIEQQLQLFGNRTRSGAESGPMHKIADKLSPKQRQQVALAYAAMLAVDR